MGEVVITFVAISAYVTSEQGDIAGNDSSRRNSREHKFVE